MRVRRRKSAAAAGGVVDPLAYVAKSRTLPPVLTPEAVAKGLMPELGQSGMPFSLEVGIPAELRFWKADTPERAREVRDELVERQVVTPSDILLVDGGPTRVLWKAFVAIEDEGTSLASRTAPGIAAGTRLNLTKDAVRIIDGEGIEPAAMQFVSSPWLGVFKDSESVREALAKQGGLTLFSLETRPGVLFASSERLADDASLVRLIEPAPTDATLEKALAGTIRIVRKDATAISEERYVFGVVLEPDVVDSQGDTYSSDEVRKAAHRFMTVHKNLGKQHTDIVTGKLVILESYLAPIDFAVGETMIKSGTWLLAIRVVDDGLWESVKLGTFTGFSIGGSAVRTPEMVA